MITVCLTEAQRQKPTKELVSDLRVIAEKHGLKFWGVLCGDLFYGEAPSGDLDFVLSGDGESKGDFAVELAGLGYQLDRGPDEPRCLRHTTLPPRKEGTQWVFKLYSI